jgi:AbrB family looped-hinge helix DNA binding protein
MSVHALTISSKGQVVIPASVRNAAGLAAGDSIVLNFDEARQELWMRKAKSIDEMAERFTSFITPGTPPLTDASELYESREPRGV